MRNTEQKLARWIAGQTVCDIPDEIRNHANLIIADSVGAIIGGISTENVANLTEINSSSNPNGIPILGTTQKTSTENAAIIYGTAGTVLELDEGHKYATGHPAMHVLPALLCEAETNPKSYGEFLTAFIIAYEAVTRVARACNPLKSRYHMHGLWGAVGAAAGVAKYRGYTDKKIKTAMQMAANHAQHTRFEAAMEGATVRNTFTGMNNLDGLVVANQTQAGFSGLHRGIERHLNAIAEEEFDATILSEDLGSLWELSRGYFKIHAACRYTHPVLDALEEILTSVSIDPNNINSIEVETYDMAAKLSDNNPSNSLQAKFSIPFAVSTKIINGRSDKQAFETQAIDETTVALAKKTTVKSTPEFESQTPDARGARVILRKVDGKVFSAEVHRPRGDPELPFTEIELQNKFESMVSPVIGADSSRELWEGIRNGRMSIQEIHLVGTPVQ